MVGGAGQIEARRWPTEPAAGSWRMLAPGTPFGTIEGPFPKIPDEVIAGEIRELHERGKP